MLRLVSFAGATLAPITLVFAVLTFGALGASRTALANDHAHHAKHNMVLFGEAEIFASHIVYKVPHNFQVILRLRLPDEARAAYLAARAAHPADQLVLLLDPSDIAAIRTAASVSGKILRDDPSGERVVVVESVTIPDADFDVLFFDEVPLSLEP